jgi:two-component system LytT family sensor kinase
MVTLTPALKFRQSWLIIAAASVLLAGLGSITTFINARVAGRSNWRDSLFVACLWLVFAPLTWIPWKLSQRFPVRWEHIAQSVVAHVAGALAMSASWTVLGILLARLTRTRQTTPFVRTFVSSILTNMPLCVFLYFAVLGCIYAVSYYREARERQAREAILAAQVSEARLSALRMQLNPHFLFNSLNAITVLVRDQKSADASRVLELLGRVLRQVLQSEKRQEVTLQDEMQFIKEYLAIEQVRFSDRLEVIWRIDPAVRQALVPTFILQPLVENAVRHGISQRDDEGLIEITAALLDLDVVLTVKDNGPGYTPGVEEGVGLANTQARLETLFGDRAQLDVKNLNGLGTVATIRLPLRREVDGSNSSDHCG